MKKIKKKMKKMTSYPSSHHRLQGFTLIEALIALLVLSIGLLGVAGMQLKALQGAHMAYQRSLASVIAVDAQERLWSKLEPGEGCPAVGDVLNEWKKYWFIEAAAKGRETLPGGEQSNIKVENSCDYTITIDWSEERSKSEEDMSVLTYQFALPDLT